MMAKYMFLLSLLSTTLCQEFYISRGELMWSSPGNNCIPATPKIDAAISYAPSVYNVSNLGVDLPHNEDVWVGYYQVVRVFEYIGCIQFAHLFLDSQPSFVKIHGDPGHCFPGCGKDTVVGVSKTKCYCLGAEFNFTRNKLRGCTEKCNHPSVACGRDYTDPRYMYLSIYKMNNKVTASSLRKTETKDVNTMMNCLKLDPNVPKRFYWERCMLSHLAMCYNIDRVEKVRCTNGREYCTWIDVANTCFTQGLLPTLYSNSKDVNIREGAQLWTGLFKTYVVYKYNANIPVERRYDKKLIGYLRKVSETEVQLKFAEEDSNKRKLCLLDRNKDWMPRLSTAHTEASTLPIVRYANKTEKDNDEKKSPTTASISAAVTTDTTFSNTTQSNTNITDMGSPVVYVAIGVSASVLLVAVVIGLLLILFKRRRKSLNQQCKHSNNSTPIEKTGNGSDGRDQALTNTSMDRHDYFILESHEKEKENKDIMNVTGNENTDYDTTQVGRISERNKMENVYNQLENTTDISYDLTIRCDGNKATTAKVNLNVNDDTYDTSTNAKNPICFEGHTDNIYNKVSDIDGDEDEYSHIGNAINKSKTDNLYGFQRIECRDKSLNDDHSTYNCIPNGHDKNEKTDNTYSSIDAK